MQMTGFENAPAVMYAYVDLPLFFISARHGAGVGFTNDQIGLFKHQKFFLQYAYHQPLWGGKLSGGIHLSMLSETFDGESWIWRSPATLRFLRLRPTGPVSI